MVLRATILQRIAPKQFVPSCCAQEEDEKKEGPHATNDEDNPTYEAYQKDPTDTTPIPPNEFLYVTSFGQRCRRRRSSARPPGPDHSVATFRGKLLLAGPLGPRGALPLVVATRPQATGLRNSGRLLLAGPLCPGPLGPAAATDDRHR